MRSPHIHGRYRTVPASLMLETLGESLEAIRQRDNAKFSDIGAALGKHEDSAARYSRGEGDMGVVSFLRGCREWDGAFANTALALVGMKIVPLDGADVCHQQSVSTVLGLALALSQELEKDGSVDDDDLDRHQFAIERAGKVIDGYRERLRARNVAATA